MFSLIDLCTHYMSKFYTRKIILMVCTPGQKSLQVRYRNISTPIKQLISSNFLKGKKIAYLHFLKRFTQYSPFSFRHSLEIAWEVSSTDTFACRKLSDEKQHFFIRLQCSPLSTTFQGVSYFDFQRSLMMEKYFSE